MTRKLIAILLLLCLLVGCQSKQKQEESASTAGSTPPASTTDTAVPATQAPPASTQGTPEPATLKWTKETYPKIDCATGMYPMTMEIAKSLLGLTDEEAEAFCPCSTTSKAYDNLIAKTCDLIFVSEPSDDILTRAKEAGVEFEMVGIGWDGFVFLLNKQNPVNDLTLDQIRDIYTGKITNWSEVGGEDLDILAYQREPNSGSQNLMEKMVMKGTPMAEAPQSLLISTMEGLIDSIATYEDSRAAIGYSIYLYAKEQYVRDGVKFLSINGVAPSDETIADGSYPLTKVVYAVFRTGEPEDSAVRQLVAYLQTEEGQKSVVAGGYVGLAK